MNKLKLKFAIIIAIVVGTTFIGCQKENEFLNSQEEVGEISSQLKKKVTNYYIDDFIVRSPNQALETLIANPNDKEDEKISNYLYHLMLSLKELTNYTEFNKSVIELAKQNSFQTANLISLTKNNNAISSIINNNLQTEFNKAKNTSSQINAKSLQEIERNLTYLCGETTEKYTPVIYIPNLKNCNPEKIPLFAISVAVNSDNDESIEDNIIVYFYDEIGNLKTSLLSEEEAMKITNPIFIVDNGSVNNGDRKVNNTSHINTDNTDNTPKSYARYDSYEYRINYRYENSGKSEFCITGGDIQTTTWGRSFLMPKSGSNYKEWKEIASVDKDDIEKDLEGWVPLCNFHKDEKTLFFNTYERDWYSSKKFLGHGQAYVGNTNANGHIYLYGNMKYESNWYTFDPSEALDSHWLNLNHIYWSWAQWFNSSKSKLRIWRCDIN